MIKLSDTQRTLLSSAAQRSDGSVLPLPAGLKPGGGTSEAIAALVKRGLADERQTDDEAATHRVDGDTRYGVFVTPTGMAALETGPQDRQGAPTATSPEPAARAPRTSSKAAAVIGLLSRDMGATLLELIEATGWLPHTTRAALTGLRKKGHEITRGKRDGATCYSIVGAA